MSKASSILIIMSMLLSACAGTSELSTATLPGTRAVNEQKVQAAVVPGRSSRAEVLAALGETTKVRFDSGYEVWVYRWEGGSPLSLVNRAPAADEYVVLFDPAGVVAKARVRVAPREGRPGA